MLTTLVSWFNGLVPDVLRELVITLLGAGVLAFFTLFRRPAAVRITGTGGGSSKYSGEEVWIARVGLSPREYFLGLRTPKDGIVIKGASLYDPQLREYLRHHVKVDGLGEGVTSTGPGIVRRSGSHLQIPIFIQRPNEQAYRPAFATGPTYTDLRRTFWLVVWDDEDRRFVLPFEIVNLGSHLEVHLRQELGVRLRWAWHHLTLRWQARNWL